MCDVNKDLAVYLKSKKGLDRLMIEFKNKYVMLSRFSGTVLLDNLTNDECLDIGNLLGKKINSKDKVKVSFKVVAKKINEGKYAGFDWDGLFYYYFGKRLVTKTEDKLNKINNEEKYFSLLYDINKDKKYVNILWDIINNDEHVKRIVKKKYNKNKDELKIDISNILGLLDKVPNKPTNLAIYSSFTGNPHYLDLNKSSGNLFYRVVAKIKNIEFFDRTDEKINILSEINVYTDPVSNFVITKGLTGDSILNVFNKNGEVINLNLLNINGLKKVDTNLKKVYVFENPSMMSALMDLEVPIIITSGIPNLALYVLLEKLISNNNIIYYNGDFDPEGLLIASKLLERFSHVKLFCYDSIDYEISKSKEVISNRRLKKLDSICDKNLDVIKNLLLKNKVAAYQEQNIDNIRKFINEKR